MSDFSEMLGVLAHEMRTPIAAILGYQELLTEGIYGQVAERGQEPLDRIGYSARQLLHLIDGMQDVTLDEKRRLQVELEPMPVAETLRSCLHYAEADAIGRNVKLEADIEEPLHDIVGETDLFCRVIDLALSAAIKTSHGATLRIVTTNSGQTVTTRIENTGLAPDRDNPDFVQSEDGKLTGAGLRLAIVRQIARKLHGEVELLPSESGTTLILRFRAADAK